MKYSEHYIQNNIIDASNYGFINWIDNVEQIVKEQIFFELLDLPDEDYMLHWNKGTTPKEMANIIFQNNQFLINFSKY